ncbi:MAG: tetratricopeptide repeat protein [Deltaproteobacteria bacterium]|jgi:tetratricopeptide (TPR) repeat protein|nr:tetratricopeptide repeat protein [Deltaproteobacteria bacterium]
MRITKIIILSFLLSLSITGCVKEQASQPPLPAEQEAEPQKPEEPDPRTLASLQLTEQGRRLVDVGKTDQAIRVLEQAISLNPDNGENYYYLAEAWLLKGVISEAKKFNQLAEIHLKDNDQWMQRIIQQTNQIAESEK